MLAAPSLESIIERLTWIPYKEWGPDGVRYVCVLFWNDHGYRMLENTYSARDWEKWDMSSGDFWDLFLAGCYGYGKHDYYGDMALPLAGGSTPFYWNREQAQLLAKTFHDNSVDVRAGGRWSFSGPLELVAVGARRYGDEIKFEWPGMRAIQLSDEPIGPIVANYTEAHVMNDAEVLPSWLPVPGDFKEDVTFREIFYSVAHLLPFVGKAFHFYKIFHGN
jgi:hypothetical protein